MRRALALARKSEGRTRPNPPVGAVLVRDGRLIGAGRHLRAGGPHAEVRAFDSCRGPAAGATLYVTLEPCSTAGRTPPCTDRILKEGVGRVVVGCVDENGRHNGRGLALLRARGVRVDVGVCGEEAYELAEPFFHLLAAGRPFVTLKLGMTLDGCIADAGGASRWITGEASRREVQRMRRRSDAVLVGAGTVCADDPSLLCRAGGGGGGARPLRVVVDGAGRVPPSARVLTDAEAGRTIVAALPGAAGRLGPAWSAGGARVWVFEPDAEGRVPLRGLLERLGREEGALRVLCEGGGVLAGALDAAGLVDEYALFYAMKILGGGVRGFGGEGRPLAGAAELDCRREKRPGGDLLLLLRPRRGK